MTTVIAAQIVTRPDVSVDGVVIHISRLGAETSEAISQVIGRKPSQRDYIRQLPDCVPNCYEVTIQVDDDQFIGHGSASSLDAGVRLAYSNAQRHVEKAVPKTIYGA